MSTLPRPHMERILALDREIRAGKYPNCTSFARNWRERFGYGKALDRRTILRDIDWLRDMMGAPVTWCHEHKGYHYTDQSWILPSFVATDERELVALLLTARATALYAETDLSRSMAGIFAKLDALAAEHAGHAPEDIRRAFSFHAPAIRRVDSVVWNTIARALLQGRALRIAHVGVRGGGTTKRRVHPWHLANIAGDWYLTAFCDLRGTMRHFAVSRIAEAADAGPADVLRPDGFDPDRQYAKRFERYVADPGEESYLISVRFDADSATWVWERIWHPEQKLTTMRDGSIRLTLPMPSLREAVRWVLSWGGAAEVLKPVALRKQLAAEAARMAALYGV